jgi:hypothetical protein
VPSAKQATPSSSPAAALWIAFIASCATVDVTEMRDVPSLKLKDVALNETAVVRGGCPAEACPAEAPLCVEVSALTYGCGGAAVRPCDTCGFFEVEQESGTCGDCACGLDCRVPFTSNGDKRCDWKSGRWRDASCREGRACASNEVCAEDGTCVPALCASDLDCALGDFCAGDRCAIHRRSVCVAEEPHAPP